LSAALAARQEQQQRADTASEAAQSLERRVADLEQRVTQRAAVPVSQPVLPAVVFALTAVRGAASDAPPVNRLTIASADRLVVFTVELPPLQGAHEYMVSLRDRAGREVWSAGPLRPSTPDSLAVAVDRALLQNGINTLEVRQRAADGRLVVIGRYPFEIRSR
jgi:hypothetical protein